MLTAQNLLDEYESGLYTGNETVARSIDALVGSDQRDQLWQSLPGWIRQQIDRILDGFSAGDEVVTFGYRDPKAAHDGGDEALARTSARQVGSLPTQNGHYESHRRSKEA